MHICPHADVGVVAVRAEPSGQPGVPQWVCHIVLATGQAAFTVGSVYLKSSMRYMDASKGEVFSPITYVFFREIFAAPIMLAIAYISTSKYSSGFDSVKDLFTISLRLGCFSHVRTLFGPHFAGNYVCSGSARGTCRTPC